MRRLFLMFVFITTIIIATGINPFISSAQQTRQVAKADKVTDDISYFLTIKDERDNENLIKTIGVFKVGNGGIEFDLGKPISSDVTKTIVPESSSSFDSE